MLIADDLKGLPQLGLGLGLRNTHFQHILDHWPEVNWFEAISENFMDSGGRPRHVLQQISERYPVVLHGVSMSIGSTDALNLAYLNKLKTLANDIDAAWVSDHLCWTGVQSLNSHDLLPVPLTEESLQHIVSRVHQVQEVLGRPLILENPSTYMSFQQSTLLEPEFLTALCQQTGCGLLLDVNNVFVSCFNARQDPMAYFADFPWERVVQMHLAGHMHCGSHIVDTHDQPVHDAVWHLYHYAWNQTANASTLLEWDANIPELDDCLVELNKAKQFQQSPPELIREKHWSSQLESQSESVSTPIHFLVDNVMRDAYEG